MKKFVSMPDTKFVMLVSFAKGWNYKSIGNETWAMLSDKAEQYPIIIHEMEPDVYTLSVLKENNQDIGSYIEVRVDEKHPLYEKVRDIVGILNVAGTEQAVEGVGEHYSNKVYSTVFDRPTYDIMLGN